MPRYRTLDKTCLRVGTERGAVVSRLGDEPRAALTIQTPEQARWYAERLLAAAAEAERRPLLKDVGAKMTAKSAGRRRPKRRCAR